MNRRHLFGLAAGAATAATALRASDTMDHGGHDHSGHDHSAHGKHASLAVASADCGAKAVACQAHCIVLIKAGDTSIIDCLTSVTDLVPTAAALKALASSASPHLGHMASAARMVVKACETECLKHAEDHAECKACADSCAALIKEIDALA
ncbi:Csp1 family four helix bundle copper storage protein [Primorskyibacter sp. S187A]|uniref:Csp1 family four helix bundle copper storage protein n=1 Tax=Primorskyibacter sp. S187A TaxID=3415130 RepID=UPI003C7DC64E